ncbi:hypothetical protein [Pseudarthrobacter sp. Y6]|jgi:hypothetical protein|uniref:hypothetical protein n=1 Tax=Pseudarthrobacter sp. Y6 TaxID=3418422 RepID=UPI003CE6C04A
MPSPEKHPQSFGDRKLISVRPPDDLYEYYDSLAAKESLDLGPWILKELSEKHKLPVPAFVGIRKRRRRKDDNCQPADSQERSVPALDDRRTLREEDRSSHPAA